VHVDFLNVQNQQKVVWPASFSVSRAYVDQLARDNGVSSERIAAITRDLTRAEGLKGTAQRDALNRLATQLDQDAKTASDGTRVRALAGSVRDLAKVKR